MSGCFERAWDNVWMGWAGWASRGYLLMCMAYGKHIMTMVRMVVVTLCKSMALGSILLHEKNLQSMQDRRSSLNSIYSRIVVVITYTHTFVDMGLQRLAKSTDRVAWRTINYRGPLRQFGRGGGCIQEGAPRPRPLPAFGLLSRNDDSSPKRELGPSLWKLPLSDRRFILKVGTPVACRAPPAPLPN